MPMYRVTINYTTRGNKRRRTTRTAEVADLTKLTRPMKLAIRKRYPTAAISLISIQRKAERRARRRKVAA